jgi:hypothetical protein
VVNVAVTFVAELIATLQVPVPEHAPDHPENVEPLAADAVSATEVPLLYASLQSDPQLIPAGDEVTVPPPVPAFDTVSVY